MSKTIAAPRFRDHPERRHLPPLLDTGEFALLSGVTGCRPDGSVAGDPERQFRDAFECLRETLAAAGMTFDHVVEVTSDHVDPRRHLAAFVAVKDEFVRPAHPAWSAIGTTEPITEGTLVEIRVVCRRPTVPPTRS